MRASVAVASFLETRQPTAVEHYHFCPPVNRIMGKKWQSGVTPTIPCVRRLLFARWGKDLDCRRRTSDGNGPLSADGSRVSPSGLEDNGRLHTSTVLPLRVSDWATTL